MKINRLFKASCAGTYPSLHPAQDPEGISPIPCPQDYSGPLRGPFYVLTWV